MAILLDKPCDITSFTDPDSTRYALGAVQYADGEVCATDGKMLIRVPVLNDDFPDTPGAGDEPSTCLIPTGLLKDVIAKASKIRSPKPALRCARLTVTKDDRVILSSTDLERSSDDTSKQIEGKFPNVNDIMPKDEPEITMTLDAKLLLKLCKHAATHARDEQVTFGIRTKDDPVSIEYSLEDGRKVRAVIMPMNS